MVQQDDAEVKLGEAGKSLIQSYEKCELKAYLPTPDDVWTLGWGHTKLVSQGDTCTKEEADQWFLEDIKWVEDCVNKSVTAHINQNEFDALCSLCFNIGCTAFGKSTLVKLLNQADYDGAREQFKRWDKQKGQVVRGLTRRRASEAELFDKEDS